LPLVNAGERGDHPACAPGMAARRGYAEAVLSIRRVPYGDPTALRLWEDMWAEMGTRYGEMRSGAQLEPDGIVASLVGFVGGEAVGSVVVRFKDYATIAPAAELKRMYVVPGRRGGGFARVLMGAAEEVTRRAGATRIILETGTEQPEAVSLYRAIGYLPIPPYGSYSHSPRSLCFAKDLPTRVLVVSGTMGAGKSAVASAVGDLLGALGARYGWIDGDALCQAGPANPRDPYNQGLLFDALAGVAPAYRKRGLGIIIVARVVEDPDDRARYAHAFRSDGGSADVTIARVTAPEGVRLARIDAREPEGEWREFGRARTVELEASLDSLDLEDLAVENAGRPAAETAAELLDAIGWRDDTF
jgi:GNAT superfamily N-acetyltransferase